MLFYLLKSSVKRGQSGDVLIDTSKVEAIRCMPKSFEDLSTPAYLLKIEMSSGDSWCGLYQTLNEAKIVMKEILGNKISEADLEESFSYYK